MGSKKYSLLVVSPYGKYCLGPNDIPGGRDRDRGGIKLATFNDGLSLLCGFCLCKASPLLKSVFSTRRRAGRIAPTTSFGMLPGVYTLPLAGRGRASAALSRCAAAHPLHTRLDSLR